jgi:hypothetical protein
MFNNCELHKNVRASYKVVWYPKAAEGESDSNDEYKRASYTACLDCLPSAMFLATTEAQIAFVERVKHGPCANIHNVAGTKFYCYERDGQYTCYCRDYGNENCGPCPVAMPV